MFEALILLGMAALGGLTMAVTANSRRTIASDVAGGVHGAVAAAGVVVLAYFALTSGIPTLAMAAVFHLHSCGAGRSHVVSRFSSAQQAATNPVRDWPWPDSGNRVRITPLELVERVLTGSLAA